MEKIRYSMSLKKKMLNQGVHNAGESLAQRCENKAGKRGEEAPWCGKYRANCQNAPAEKTKPMMMDESPLMVGIAKVENGLSPRSGYDRPRKNRVIELERGRKSKKGMTGSPRKRKSMIGGKGTPKMGQYLATRVEGGAKPPGWLGRKKQHDVTVMLS